MTPPQLRIVVALSLLCTLVVLGAGLRDDGSPDAASALVGQRRPVTIAAPALGASSTPASASDSGEAGSGDEAPSADSSGEGGGASTTPATSGAPSQRSGAGTGEGGASTGEGSGGTEPGSGAADAAPPPTKVRHVFVIALAGHGFAQAFGPGSPAAYLDATLRPKGALLSGYETLGHADLPDELAAIGGQPPNASTRASCPTYREIPPSVAPSGDGVVSADGCVFPNTVTTIADQLDASRRSWRAYVEDLDRGPAPAAGAPPKATCRHPGSNQPDEWVRARPGDGYATRHNPFVYYHSLLDLGGCDADDGGLTQLGHDLASARDAASLSWIVPNLCHDGTEAPCVDGGPGGLAAADAFLATWVPRILASPAYKADGVLIVTFAGDVTPPPDPTHPPADAPVREGMLIVSRWTRADSTDATTYDPYGLLRSLEDLFGLKPLARAAHARSFAPAVLAGAYLTPARA